MDSEKWNRRYLEKDLLWSAEPNRFLVDEVANLPPGRALDLGAGEGRNAIWLAERGWRVTAVEFADAAVERGRCIAAERGVEVEWVCSDLLEWIPELSRSDLVLLLYLHLPADEMRTVLGRAQSAVAAGGTLVFIGHDRSNLEDGHGGPQDSSVLYTADTVASELTDLSVETAGTRQRPVETEHGTVYAIDCLVRAHRPL